jgi:2-polyprenyl-3-methyl-5-hydroxy-6-metoxy-1,4-benzoquinol methylase
MSSKGAIPRIEKIHWTPELVETFWNGVAHTRLDDLSFGKVAGPDFLNLIESFLKPGGRHLDFGSGSGDVVKLLLERGYRTAGYDPAPERQAKLAEKIGAHEHFLGIEGSESRNQYDVVLLMEVIEHILEPDFAATMRTISNFVSPAGLLIVSTPNHEDIELASVFCPVSETLFHPWQHVRSFTPRSLCETLERFGFQKERLILADFSNDANLIENCKRFEATEARRALLTRKLVQAVDDLRNDIEEQGECAARLSRSADLDSRAGFMHRFLKAVFSWSKRIGALIELKQMFARMQNQLQVRSDTLAGIQREFLTVNQHAAGIESDVDHEGINLRIGRETTIVYVGRRV